MIIELKIALVRGLYFDDQWAAKIELDESSTLEDLHLAIQTAVGFDNDHAYSFFTSRTLQSRTREYYHHDEPEIEKTLREIFPLPPKHSFFYLFDWGDEWIFKISQTRKRPHVPDAAVTYPNVVSELGTRPEQYPSFDDD
jgi:Plasmid pRiA4b ORF-3-like protein